MTRLEERWRMTVHGRVQGVGFRWFSRDEAVKLGVKGWARNLPDGTVEIEAQASPEELENYRERIRAGNPHARVERVETAKRDPSPSSSFDIR